ncbi:MAG: ROK family transcriptional regulator [Chloroflexota bacterium]|nr:ROK family transcriptional regulator [Chloroflexota bacterium]MDQ5867479.1 ROK family transcriptional regulator [Chloroflexota bacterium]
MAQLQKATQQQTKTYNSRLVLKTIYDQGRVSRADVARLTHLTRTTVSDLVTDLQEKGLVEEVGMGRSLGGRSPVLLSVIDDARHLISLDLANDELRGAVVNLRNEVVSTVTLPVADRAGDDALSLVYELLDKLVYSTDRPILGIGIGTPGLVDTTHGVVLRAVNLDWRDLPLGSILEQRYRLPVYVANDSQLAALAQYMFGGRSYGPNLVMVKIGHGVGAGIVLNGGLFQGDGYGAGEIGHLTVEERGQKCRCGNSGCLEMLVSTHAMKARACALASEHPFSPLNYMDLAYELDTDTINRAFASKDVAATYLMRETGRYLGMVVANLIGTLNVKHIVLMGDLARFGSPLLEIIRQEMLVRSLPPLAQATCIDLVEMNPHVVILGASALLLMHELGLSLTR